jgi:hypothetical protein
MKTSLKVIACMVALAVFVAVQSASAQGKLAGVWKITEVTLTGPNAQKITNPQPSFVIFTKKYSSMVGITGDKPQPVLPQTNATDAQKLATWTLLGVGFATYEIKGSTITRHPIVAKNGVKPGSFNTADFKIEGNTLTITSKTNQDGPVANPMTIKLVRVE